MHLNGTLPGLACSAAFSLQILRQPRRICPWSGKTECFNNVSLLTRLSLRGTAAPPFPSGETHCSAQTDSVDVEQAASMEPISPHCRGDGPSCRRNTEQKKKQLRPSKILFGFWWGGRFHAVAPRAWTDRNENLSCPFPAVVLKLSLCRGH